MSDAARVVARHELLRAAPYAIVLAVALGGVVTVGAHLSNAFPSADHPFGWEGPSSFENAVAMVRGDLVLAATLPALLLGATAARALPRDRPIALPVILGIDLLLLAAACVLAATIGSFGARKTPTLAFVAFSGAHALLAVSFYSLAFLGGSILRRHAVPAALAVWLFFNAVYEGLTRIALFRQMGYHRLAAGEFPTWFLVAQGLSPLSAYRGVLILWDRKFMDGLEKATIGKATLPAWVNPTTFASMGLLLWVALPLSLAALVVWWRNRAVSRLRAPTPA